MSESGGGLLLISLSLVILAELVQVAYNYVQIGRAKKQIRSERQRIASWDRLRVCCDEQGNPIDPRSDFR